MREFLMLAKQFETDHSIGGWYGSEKLDGQRIYWDGGITRGMIKSEVPWANNNGDERYRLPPIATGLWSRYGNVIHAPDWWLDMLPPIPLDGEGWLGYGKREELRQIISCIEPGPGWKDVQYHVFGCPPYVCFAQADRINNPNFKKIIGGDTLDFVRKNVKSAMFLKPYDFQAEQFILKQNIPRGQQLLRHLPQIELPLQYESALCKLNELCEKVQSHGGEGVVLRKPISIWTPKRTGELLKVKPLDDAECTIIGYTTGKHTNLGSKLRGMVGNVIVKFNNVTFELAGFTDAERHLAGDARNWAWDHPGQTLPDHYEAASFKRGQVISFKYRGLTKYGVPNEARYWRPA